MVSIGTPKSKSPQEHKNTEVSYVNTLEHATLQAVPLILMSSCRGMPGFFFMTTVSGSKNLCQRRLPFPYIDGTHQLTPGRLVPVRQTSRFIAGYPARSFFSKEGATSLKTVFLIFLVFLWAFFRNSNSWFLTTAISGPPSSGYKTCVTESPAILKLG